jgi:glycosyltransferase involved in cell wall biosynthesis
MNQVKISIVHSNFNGGNLLKNSIQSVLDQTFQDWELILIDDCSTDQSREIISAFHDDRIKVTYFEKNQHMCYAFNYGISISRGKYIARIDSDDTWLPDKLEKQYVFMEKNEKYGACFTWVNVVDEFARLLTKKQTDRVSLFSVNNMEQHQWLRYFYFEGSCLCHPSVLIRKSVLDDVGVYNIALVQIQDFDLWVRIVKKYSIYIIMEPLVNYCWFTTGKNTSNPSHDTNIRSGFEFYYVLSRYFDDLPNDLFIKAFGDDFVIKGVTDKPHLECEKALLLLKPVFCGHTPKIGGMNKLVNLLENDVTREILLRDYSITQKNFYELSVSPALYDPEILDLNIVPRKILLKELVRIIFYKHKLIYSILRGIYRFIT